MGSLCLRSFQAFLARRLKPPSLDGRRRYDAMMAQSHPGSFRLFQLFGIDVSIHWSWFLVAVFQIQWFRNLFDGPYWHVLLYLSLFGIVLLHAFGHALACRSVGGRADHIVLWPLGGIAFVQPPSRPGAVLGDLEALRGVVKFPVRIKCATLSWNTLLQSLDEAKA